MNLGKNEEKLKLLSEENKSENESMGIVYLMNSMIEKRELFDNIEELNFPKLKDILFLFNTMYQKNLDVNLSDENFNKILTNHQLTQEFIKAFEVMMKKSQKEMDSLLYEWRQTIPTTERSPYEARTIINQRNFFSDQFFDLYLYYNQLKKQKDLFYDVNKNKLFEDLEKKKILDNPLYNKMQILKIERFYGLKPSLDLNIIPYDEFFLQNTIPSSIYKLYKENYFSGKKNNMVKIMSVVNKKYKRSMINKFRVFDLKMALKENNLLEGFNIVNEIANTINKEGCCGKFFENYFELLFQFITQSEIYSETLLLDLFDIMSKSLVYDYAKNSNPLFYKFLIINYLYGNDKKSSLKKPKKKEAEDGMILEETKQKNKSFSGRIIEILNNCPRKIFKSHLMEICSFLDYNDDKNNKVSKLVFDLLLKEDPFDLFYNIESLNIIIDANFFQQMEINLKKNLEGFKFMTYKNLVSIVDKYVETNKINVYILIRQIIDHFYTTGKLENNLTGELIKIEEKIQTLFLNIQQQNISAIDKIFSVIMFLENWIKNNKPEKKIFVPEFLENNIIYLQAKNKEHLEISNNYERKKYFIEPYFEIKMIQENLTIFLHVYDIQKKKKILQIKPYFSQRRKYLVKTKEDMSIYLIREKILKIFYENFAKNSNTKNYVPALQNNFVILSKNWYMVDNIKNVSLLKILNSHYNKEDFENIHRNFKIRGNEGPEIAVKNMLDIYPNKVFYDYLIKKMQEPSQIYLMSQNIAGSLAYDSFINFIFGFKNHFSDANLDVNHGHVYYDITSSFENKKKKFHPRLTPNFLYLFKYPILREDFITVLLSLKDQFLDKNNNIFLLYAVLILEYTTSPIKTFASLIDASKNYSNLLEDFDIDFIQNFIEKNTTKEFYLKNYKLIDRPWF